jgi:hypothetical protein
VDSSVYAWKDPAPGEVLQRAGVRHRLSLDRRYWTYTWFLKEELARRSDAHGNCQPAYDFCFLDGSKNWTIDGLAVLLIERLLRTGGWLLLNDLAGATSTAHRRAAGTTSSRSAICPSRSARNRTSVPS